MTDLQIRTTAIMQICMKSATELAAELAEVLRERAESKGIGPAALARMSGVDQSQVGRILGGHFVRRSQNVMQICKALGVSLEGPAPRPRYTGYEAEIAQKALRLWDGTAEGADQLIALLEQLNELRRQGQ